MNPQILKFIPEKKEVAPVCVCDCLPCKTDTCDRCELPNDYGGINALCSEECNSDYVAGYNQAIDDVISDLSKVDLWIVPSEEDLYDTIFNVLYSSETDSHLEIKDIKADSWDGVPGYSAVSLNLAKAIIAMLKGGQDDK